MWNVLSRRSHAAETRLLWITNDINELRLRVERATGTSSSNRWDRTARYIGPVLTPDAQPTIWRAWDFTAAPSDVLSRATEYWDRDIRFLQPYRSFIVQEMKPQIVFPLFLPVVCMYDQLFYRQLSQLIKIHLHDYFYMILPHRKLPLYVRTKLSTAINCIFSQAIYSSRSTSFLFSFFISLQINECYNKY